MANIFKLSLLFCLIAFSACQDYNDQDGWGGECLTGIEQSPININKDIPPKKCDPDFTFVLTSINGKYTQIPYNPHNQNLKTPFNLSTIVANTPAGRKTFRAIQFHFHYKAEHHISHWQYPLELHIVHQAEDKSLAVYGILFNVAPGLDKDVFDNWNLDTNTSIDQPFPINLTTPDNAYHYNGSLTTPGCNEGVLWFVNPNPIGVKYRSIEKLRKMINEGEPNNRKVQQLNGRRIVETGKVCSIKPAAHFAAPASIHRLTIKQ